MTTNCRFALDEKRYVIDLHNSADSGKGYCNEGNPEDDKHLRECILMMHLEKMAAKLIINSRPVQTLPYRHHNDKYYAGLEAFLAIWWVTLYTIKASHL